MSDCAIIPLLQTDTNIDNVILNSIDGHPQL